MKKLLNTLSADELRKRLSWKCPLKGHWGHNGIEHNTCYEKIVGIDNEERVAYADIEAEDLKADFGIAFCWYLLDAQTNKMYSDCITKDDIKKYSSNNRDKQPKEDKRIIQSFIDISKNYDRLVFHFGSRYDLPFLRTRAVICDLEFPSYGSLYQTDTWQILKHKFKLSRNTLQNGCLKLLGYSRKDHLSLSIKHGVLRGEQWAIDATRKHCEKDVLDLKDMTKKIIFSIKKTKTSI